ncbi:methyl-accepting chemotaxis protein [Peredibacter sp. HCB2-198]|uniref:methyl-accepting chemotaxis protein n=1 Tax=Peredibacter sp. HCB2-198 TaxID=3383025 RepID=UPI0038B5D6DF
MNLSWKSFSFRKKTLTLLVAAMIPPWLIVSFYVLPLMKKNMYEDKQTAVRQTVDVVTKGIEHYYSLYTQNLMSEEEAKKSALKLVEQLRYSGKEYFWINDLYPKMVMHPLKPEMNGSDLTNYKDPNGKALFVEMTKIAQTEVGEGIVDYMWPKPGSPKPEPKISFVRQFKPWKWIVGSGVYVDDIETAIAAFRMKILLGFGFAFVAAYAIFYVFTGRLMNMLTQTVADTTEAGGQVLTASEMLATAGNNVAQGATESSSRIEESLKSVSDLNSIVQNNKGRAVAAAELAKSSEDGANQGAIELKKLIDAINDMAKTSEEITKAMRIIDDIAFQTNLLALNAAVEAARAGEQGRGFAVVADAVRGLASKSAEAAKEVQTIVQNSVDQSHLSLKLAGNSDKALDNILSFVKKVSVLNQEISESTEQQTQGIASIQEAMAALKDQSHHFASAAEETAATSEEMSSQAKNLQEMVNRIATEVRGRAA